MAGASTDSSEGPPLLVVTGASGFLGSHLVAEAVAAGWRVRACLRRPFAEIPCGVEPWVVGELCADTQWSAVLEGAEAVIHCAGLAHIGRRDAATREAEFIRANVDGTKSLAEAAVVARVRRFVFVSSIGVNGSVTRGLPFRSSDVPNPVGIYARSKWLAEQALTEVARGGGLETVVVRPTLIVGPNAPGNVERLVKLVSRGWWLPLGGVRNRRSLISVQYLAELLLACARDPRAAGQLLLAAEAPSLSTREIIMAVASGLGRRARLLWLPVVALRCAGALVGRQQEISSLCDSLEVDADPASRLLDAKVRPGIGQRVAESAAGVSGAR